MSLHFTEYANNVSNRFHKVRRPFQLIKSPLNEKNPALHYQSSHEFVAFIEFSMRLKKPLHLGFNHLYHTFSIGSV